MAAADTIALVTRYYDAFNRGDSEGMIACVADDVVHDVNQGARRSGKAAFRQFCAHMSRCYKEQLEGIVVMADADGARAAAEFNVIGTYLVAEEGLPPANGQTYRAAGRHVLRRARRPDHPHHHLLQSDRLAAAGGRRGRRMTVRVEPLAGEALARGLPALARLRIAVFRDWPYLYDGTLDHEQTYLAKLAAAPGAVIVAACDGDEIVGCATAAPLAEVEGEFAAPFWRAKGYDIATHLLLRGVRAAAGLSRPGPRPRLLRPARGARPRARRLRRTRRSAPWCARTTIRCGRPTTCRSSVLEQARLRQGSTAWSARFAWKDIDQPAETAKPMQFWMKARLMASPRSGSPPRSIRSSASPRSATTATSSRAGLPRRPAAARSCWCFPSTAPWSMPAPAATRLPAISRRRWPPCPTRCAEMDAAHAELARRHGVHILAASGPSRAAGGRYVNAARLFAPDRPRWACRRS